jgi:hypothetical protein
MPQKRFTTTNAAPILRWFAMYDLIHSSGVVERLMALWLAIAVGMIL